MPCVLSSNILTVVGTYMAGNEDIQALHDKKKLQTVLML